jgi:hypothetical protein
MTKPGIIVTGATGKTGSVVVSELRTPVAQWLYLHRHLKGVLSMTQRQWMLTWSVATSLMLTVSAAAHAQPPVPTPTTAVLVSLTIKPDVDRAELMKTMPAEVRATLKLYLDGKIQQWYSRADGRGVIFILNSTDATAAKAVMDELPLAKSNLANFEYTALGPLSPLRSLMTAPAGAPEEHH